MLKKIIIALFALKMLAWIAILAFDMISPDSYIEIANETWLTNWFHIYGAGIVIFFGLMIFGVAGERRWVLPLYSLIFLALLVAVGRIAWLLVNIEGFELTNTLIGAAVVLAGPLLIWIALYYLSGLIDPEYEADPAD